MEQSSILFAKFDCPVAHQNFLLLATDMVVKLAYWLFSNLSCFPTVSCPAGYYCPNWNTTLKCPTGKDSLLNNATSEKDCFCKDGAECQDPTKSTGTSLMRTLFLQITS